MNGYANSDEVQKWFDGGEYLKEPKLNRARLSQIIKGFEIRLNYWADFVSRETTPEEIKTYVFDTLSGNTSFFRYTALSPLEDIRVLTADRIASLNTERLNYLPKEVANLAKDESIKVRIGFAKNAPYRYIIDMMEDPEVTVRVEVAQKISIDAVPTMIETETDSGVLEILNSRYEKYRLIQQRR